MGEEDGKVLNLKIQIEVMLPLYPPAGSPVCGYVCTQTSAEGRKCKMVTRTKKGMWAHLRVVHGIRKQAKLKFEETAA
jgi:hypothetical protein